MMISYTCVTWSTMLFRHHCHISNTFSIYDGHLLLININIWALVAAIWHCSAWWVYGKSTMFILSWLQLVTQYLGCAESPLVYIIVVLSDQYFIITKRAYGRHRHAITTFYFSETLLLYGIIIITLCVYVLNIDNYVTIYKSYLNVIGQTSQPALDIWVLISVLHQITLGVVLHNHVKLLYLNKSMNSKSVNCQSP